METKFVPLVAVPRILRDEFKVEATYRQVYNLALDGKIGAVKEVQSGRWMVPEDRLVSINGHLRPAPIEIA